jgi:hypothetical protein
VRISCFKLLDRLQAEWLFWHSLKHSEFGKWRCGFERWHRGSLFSSSCNGRLVITVLCFHPVCPSTAYRRCLNSLSTHEPIFINSFTCCLREKYHAVGSFCPLIYSSLRTITVSNSDPGRTWFLTSILRRIYVRQLKFIGWHIDSGYCQSCVNSIVHGWKWLGIKNQRIRISISPSLHANCSSIVPQWKIVNAGNGIYYLQSLHENLYVGWEEGDLREGGKVVMSKTPYYWAITTSSSLTHQ